MSTLFHAHKGDNRPSTDLGNLIVAKISSPWATGRSYSETIPLEEGLALLRSLTLNEGIGENFPAIVFRIDRSVRFPSMQHPLPSPIARRRTFAIISHPDAGKTTLTEKLLLMGGAIHLAGAVRARGEGRRTRSDWMKIERQRGISVTTSVMTFEYGGYTFNLLDTPGHEDFSEDTYRTLTAVDSAVMVIDAAKGIENQTRKLFEVCRLRDVPILTFVNKMDREGRDPFALMDEISDQLALDTTPLTWPVGSGSDFRGCHDLLDDRMTLVEKGTNVPLTPLERAQLEEEIALIGAACPAFDPASYREGHLTPVLFGSALRNFGVRDVLETLARFAPAPRAQPAEARLVDPMEERVTGFVFKVQANMDPNHRDRVAFIRLCSGRFRRGMTLTQVGTGKTISIYNPILFFAQNRELVEEAWPGDIIGVPNHGTLRVGDSLTEGERLCFTGIPNFAPEILRRVRTIDPMKAKHLKRALESLAEEGVTQVFRPLPGTDWIVGVVGALQLDVLADRLATEYGLDTVLETAPYETARWVTTDAAAEIKRFIEAQRSSLAEDGYGRLVFLARNAWEIGHVGEKWPLLRFQSTCERT
ncbi:MAG: peptide chain release factor 3 [Rhodospirillaceae bacterium]|nr:MAG: peptide chain release factor 3 [Rhodospirillaceae bacterium]